MPRLGRFVPEKETPYPLYRKLVWPQGLPGGVRKISYPTELSPRTVQPVVSRYTPYTFISVCLEEVTEPQVRQQRQ